MSVDIVLRTLIQLFRRISLYFQRCQQCSCFRIGYLASEHEIFCPTTKTEMHRLAHAQNSDHIHIVQRLKLRDRRTIFGIPGRYLLSHHQFGSRNQCSRIASLCVLPVCSFAHEPHPEWNIRCCAIVEGQSHLLGRPGRAFACPEDHLVLTFHRYPAGFVLRKFS